MNAPAKIAPARDKYIPIVTHHVPGCTGRDLMLRCSILLMRDQATATMRKCSDEAFGVMQQIQQLANAYAYAALPADELAELRYQMLRLTMAASGLEQFAYRRAYPEEAHVG